jgi:hypothetical protein
VSLSATRPATAQETIKVGILHSLSGTMAISETTLKDVMLMLIEEQNKKGRVARQEVRGGGRRSYLQLAAVCRKGAGAHKQGKSGRAGMMRLAVASDHT